jgi:hypothetical protein
VIDKLDAAIVDALADSTVRERLMKLGLEIFPRDQQTPEALAALQKAETKADIRQRRWHVRFVPKADSCGAAKALLFDHFVGTTRRRSPLKGTRGYNHNYR